ncbi:hypothetical protein ACJ73_08928 [Blastomyces percursus]|uniref:Uncharacterized protein n=1 Tax=Blastomyces percursus TaxID=1658174 RepID=A0A1J9PJ71_9EURO|nr:hypothetical protein ACJ73_08928 [Blastomyces percursus]
MSGRLASPRKPNYKAILERHEAAGRTSRISSANAERSRGTVRRKLQRLCTEEESLENLTAGRAKTYFNWLEDTHQNSIKAVTAFDGYWRLLKTFIRTSIKRWGRPRRKPSGTKDDVYRNLHTHWTRCTKAYADEKQRLYVAAGILLSFISGARLVSLFDTRIKTVDEEAGDVQSKGVSPTVSKGSKNKTNRRRRRPRPRTTGAAPDRYSTAGSEIGQHDNRPTAPEKRQRALSDDNTEYRGTKEA